MDENVRSEHQLAETNLPRSLQSTFDSAYMSTEAIRLMISALLQPVRGPWRDLHDVAPNRSGPAEGKIAQPLAQSWESMCDDIRSRRAGVPSV
jgi:hypothetical protein